jgi:hypothetical protein
MSDDGKKPRFSWYEPLQNRGRVIVITVAGLILVGAVVAAVILGIPFF